MITHITLSEDLFDMLSVDVFNFFGDDRINSQFVFVCFNCKLLSDLGICSGVEPLKDCKIYQKLSLRKTEIIHFLIIIYKENVYIYCIKRINIFLWNVF